MRQICPVTFQSQYNFEFSHFIVWTHAVNNQLPQNFVTTYRKIN